MLDAYLKELGKVQSAVSAQAAVASGANPAAAAPPDAMVVRTGDAASGGAGSMNIVTDVKQQARWLLHEAVEQISLGNYDEADAKIAAAEKLDVKWGLFEDTPTKVRKELDKQRPKTVAVKPTPSGKPGDRKTARAKLREARNALSGHQYDLAEALAREVKGWKLGFGLFEDNPDKVMAAARALRRRDKIRNASPREQASPGVYDILVQESRQLMKAGNLDAAEMKARQAQRMNVVPPLTADRAEAVLHDIEMARTGKAPATPAAESPSLAAEREANDLLAQGQQAKAAARFAEAERLRRLEPGAAPAVDPAVQKVGDEEPGPSRS